ncbi:DUF1269 domain-containing protein [Paracoccus sp. PS-1]|uniref:DUF1269 domain-containing protein n=1 Tax=unclassified Paracoccus (in: a-proteobacteria) TaxID=2688777 RepID=UPI00048EAD21|nr:MULTISPECIES: DUF1269 domain-containing protein [unclassified Paracoccus (in: a-proteobacteria)]MDQ7260585.1 DUF1269 domain-containing protein [Paracoccus sp. PS1]RQP06441.1 MAG: DUF1269 domain-containing protein [Paracoccus sp. BP8]UFM65558.1 DUF1269 domain-containing protein [Paracoccus sp. MA]
MSDLLVIAFDDEATGFELRTELVKMQKEYLIELEDAVVVTRPSAEDIQLHQAVNLTAAGALGGGFWGTLVGLIFLNPLLGAAVGAGAGAIAGKLSDIGINDDFMRDLGQSIPPGGSAVFILVRKMTADKVLARLEGFHLRGRVLQTSLPEAEEERLREAFAGGRLGAALGVPQIDHPAPAGTTAPPGSA